MISPDLISSFTNTIPTVATFIGAVGGIIAAFKAIIEMRQNRKQKEIEHHWRQAAQAQLMLEKIKGEYKTSSALQMLDYGGRKYRVTDDCESRISTNDRNNALRTENLTFNKEEVFVRDCFDRLFESIENIEHFIRRDLVQFSDVSKPLQYYVNIINKKKPVYEFVRHYNYKLVEDFIDRYNLDS